MSELRIETVEDPRALIVKLGGSLTLLEEHEFNQFVRSLAGRKCPLLVLDLSELNQLSSAGIGAFLRLRQTLTAQNGALRMSAPPTHILQVLQFSRLTDVFPIFPTVAEALQPAK